MNENKVSIILPCYNGANTIRRAIMGIINQTYRPIELIIINDGSTDSTDQIICSMKDSLTDAHVEIKYHVQTNLGLGGAINTGLKHVTGDFLAWVDADDELLPDSVQIRVDYLQQNSTFGSVSSNAYLAEDNNWSHILGTITDKVSINSDPNQFMHMLMSRSIFCSGCHLIRTEVFKKANNGMEIYPARHGQNWQLLLPVYFTSKHAFINIPLYKYRINAQNMSSEIENMTIKELCIRRREYINIVDHTLKRIDGMTSTSYKHYLRLFKKHIYEQNLDSALEKHSTLGILKWKVVVKYMAYICRKHTFTDN